MAAISSYTENYLQFEMKLYITLYMHKAGIMGKLRSAAIIAVLLIAAQSLAIAQSNGVCPGFSSRLSRGMTARVTPGDANNVRGGAGRNFERTGQIPGGGDNGQRSVP
jgi:hypothetical protein